MKIYNVNDPEFKDFGKVISGYEIAPLIAGMMETEFPEEGVIYIPGVEALEKLEVCKQIEDDLYGIPIQVGCCNGHNTKLNALEYHRTSEINVACGSDMILLLGREQDLDEEYRLDTSKVKAFLVPEGTMVEVYATSLHYAPCQTCEEGFRAVIILPKGTNYPLEKQPVIRCGEEKLITATNKWLIAHEEGGCGDAFVGLIGKNLDVTED